MKNKKGTVIIFVIAMISLIGNVILLTELGKYKFIEQIEKASIKEQQMIESRYELCGNVPMTQAKLDSLAWVGSSLCYPENYKIIQVSDTLFKILIPTNAPYPFEHFRSFNNCDSAYAEVYREVDRMKEYYIKNSWKDNFKNTQ